MMKIKNAVIASVFIFACAGLAFSAIPPLDGLMTPPSILSSTATGKTVRALSGKLCVAASSATAGTCTTYIDGTLGINSTKQITASSITSSGNLSAAQITASSASLSSQLIVLGSATVAGAGGIYLKANVNTLVMENSATSNALEGSIIYLRSNDGSTNASGDRLGLLIFGGNANGTLTNSASIESYADRGWGAADAPASLVFKVAPDGSATRAEAMRITSGGASVFSGTMTVSGASGTYGLTVSSNVSLGGVLYTAAGNTGIGTIAPATKLHISGGSLEISSASPSGLGGGIIFQDDPAISDASKMWLGVTPNPAQDLTIRRLYSGTVYDVATFNRTNGNVGIGTTAPDRKLTIVGDSGIDSSQVHIGTGANSGFFINGGTSGDGGARGTIEVGSYLLAGERKATQITAAGIGFIDGKFSIRTDSGLTIGNTFTASTRMTVDTAGNVGIGNASPAHKLDVTGDANFATAVTASSFTATGEIGFKTYKETVVVTTISAANYDVGWSSGSVYDIALASSTTLTFSGAKDGQSMTFFVYQSSNSKIISWPTGTIWPGGVTPALSTSTAKTDIFSFFYRGGRYFGFTGGQGY